MNILHCVGGVSIFTTEACRQAGQCWALHYDDACTMLIHTAGMHETASLQCCYRLACVGVQPNNRSMGPMMVEMICPHCCAL